MGQSVKVTYIEHSGFMVETEHSCLLFDYWKGEIPEIPSRKDLYVFSSHAHKDHYTKNIFKLENRCSNVYYILSSDIRIGNRDWRRAENVTFVEPHRNITVGRCNIRTLRSTDQGVAFAVKADGINVYHAGDLHWWEWPGEPERYNERMITSYKKELERIKLERFDLAFVVLDPRQEEAGTRGLDYFRRNIQSRYIFPMHVWEKYNLITEYIENNQNKLMTGQIMDISARGQSFLLTL